MADPDVFLFVGGPLDGQRRGFELAPHPYRHALRHVESEETVYHCSRFAGGTQIFYIYAPGGWDGDRILGRLIDGYQRPPDEPAEETAEELHAHEARERLRDQLRELGL